MPRNERLKGIYFYAPIDLMARVRALSKRDNERVGVVLRRVLRQGLIVEERRQRREELRG